MTRGGIYSRDEDNFEYPSNREGRGFKLAFQLKPVKVSNMLALVADFTYSR